VHRKYAESIFSIDKSILACYIVVKDESNGVPVIGAPFVFLLTIVRNGAYVGVT